MRIFVSKLASKDIVIYGKYLIKEANLKISEDFVSEVKQILELILKNPKIGNSYSNRFIQTKSIRYFIITKYKQIIFYEINDDVIRIIRILSSNMDIKNILKVT